MIIGIQNPVVTFLHISAAFQVYAWPARTTSHDTAPIASTKLLGGHEVSPVIRLYSDQGNFETIVQVSAETLQPTITLSPARTNIGPIVYDNNGERDGGNLEARNPRNGGRPNDSGNSTDNTTTTSRTPTYTLDPASTSGASISMITSEALSGADPRGAAELRCIPYIVAVLIALSSMTVGMSLIL